VEIFPSDDNLVRRVRLSIADAEKLDRKGRRIKPEIQLERPIHKLIFLFRPPKFDTCPK